MKKFLYNLKLFLESIDSLRDRFLYPLIKSYWPCQITPNHLTYTRFIIGAWLLILLFGFKNNNHTLIVTLFFVGIITDFLDGPIARCLKMETDWGATIDPLADKLLIVPIAVYILAKSNAFLLFLIITLEVINVSISIFIFGKKILLALNVFDKIKMFLQSIGFINILFFWPQKLNIFSIYVLWLSLVFIIISIIIKIFKTKLLISQHTK